MKVLKGYVRNHFHPEGCIAECYVAEESAEFWCDFKQDGCAIGVPNDISSLSGPISVPTLRQLNEKERAQAHLHVLSNNDEVDPYKMYVIPDVYFS